MRIPRRTRDGSELAHPLPLDGATGRRNPSRRREGLSGPDPDALLRLVERWRDEAVKAGKMIERIALAFEAGRDGFWLARWLHGARYEVHVIHL